MESADESAAPGLELTPPDEGTVSVPWPAGGTALVHRAGDAIRACTASCRHMGGTLTPAADGRTAHCARHGWTLDLATMTYTNPSGGLTQPELAIEQRRDTVVLRDPRRRTDWQPRPRATLSPGELTVEFWTHACAEITAGRNRIVTDPWLTGPAFTLGWWLRHTPPADWLDRLASADLIYISHNHSDHLNLHTLEALVARRPDVPMVVPAFASGSVRKPLERLGFTAIRELAPTRWFELDNETRVMVLVDHAGRDDSALLVDHRGHLVLDTVDCAQPNGLDLPEGVDLLLSAFAGGASGYPLCWPDLYSQRHIDAALARNRRAVLELVKDLVGACRPRIAAPFAGSFVEAHPADHAILALNRKNSTGDFRRVVHQVDPGVTVWVPDSGHRLDVGCSSDGGPSVTQPAVAHPAPTHDFEHWEARLRDDALVMPLDDACLEQYFAWAGLRLPVLLHLIETDERFEEVRRERFVDLQTWSVSRSRPVTDHRYLRLRVRSDAFRWVLATGAPWEEFSIGFQARFHRDPDIYDFEFWNHFQNDLPPTPPDWPTVANRRAA